MRYSLFKYILFTGLALISVFYLISQYLSPQLNSLDLNLLHSSFPDVYMNKRLTNSQNTEYYAIITSNKNIWYMFPLPLTVLCWRKLGVQSIVMLVGSEEEILQTQVYAYIVQILKRLEAIVIFIQPKFELVPKSTLSQVARLYAPMLPFVQKINKNSVFITADSDMLSFNLSQHIPNVNNGEKLKVYNSYQKNSKFGYIKVPKQKQKVMHYPLNTIAASMETWRDIMGIAQINDSSHLSQVIIDELGTKMLQGPQLRNSELWFADEALASYKIDLWLKKSNNSAHFSHYPHVNRIERLIWHKYNFAKLDITRYDDCHLMNEAYLDSKWMTIMPLLKLIFPDNETLRFLNEYQMNVNILSNTTY